MIEEWRDTEYTGYQVSNLGRVKSFKKYYDSNGRIIKPIKMKSGYYEIGLSINGIKYREYIHRLVAKAFIPNPKCYPLINHKDENPANNCVDNLEWCTQKYNMNYGSLLDKHKRESKAVLQYDLDNNFIKRWESIANAEKELKIPHCNIVACLKGRRKYAGKYIWKYAIDIQ